MSWSYWGWTGVRDSFSKEVAMIQMIQAHIRGETQELQSHAALSCVVGAGPPPFSLETSPGSHPSPSPFLSPEPGPWKDTYSWTLKCERACGPLASTHLSEPHSEGQMGSRDICWTLLSWQPLLLLKCALGTHNPGYSLTPRA